jgi:hypothetical protein
MKITTELKINAHFYFSKPMELLLVPNDRCLALSSVCLCYVLLLSFAPVYLVFRLLSKNVNK